MRARAGPDGSGARPGGHGCAREAGGPAGGYLSARSSGPIAATPRLEENISFARLTSLLAHYSGDASQRASAEVSCRSARCTWRNHRARHTACRRRVAHRPAAPDHHRRKSRRWRKSTFFHSATSAATVQARRRWDRSEGELPNADVGYPPTKRAATFLCTANRCSLAIFSAAEIVPFLLESTTAKPTAAVNTTATHD